MIVMDTRSQLTVNKTPNTVKPKIKTLIKVAELGCREHLS
ncbi:hypothetical protein EQ875_01354 [Photobacterium damselae subsp. damselae]|nr:hypothetical protein EQ875_01354 [Photobacterium damselae subsp. damselae]